MLLCMTGDHGIEALLLHDGFVRALARSLVLDGSAADDMAQDAFAVALRRPPPAGVEARAWLSGIVRRLHHRWRRDRQRRVRETELAAAEGPTPDAATILAREEARRILVHAVLALSPPLRETILLRYFENLPPRTIAARLTIPVETVRTRTKRALAELRTVLQRPSDRLDDRAPFALLAPLACQIPAAPLAATSALAALLAMKTLLPVFALIVVIAVAAWWPSEPAPTPSVSAPAAGPTATAAGGGAARDTGAPAPSNHRGAATTPDSPLAAITTGTLRVRVLRANDRTPIAGTGVRLRPGVAMSHLDLACERTDAGGEVEFGNLRPGLFCASLEFGSGDVFTAVDAAITRTVDILAPPGYAVHGVVVDPDGTPVAGAIVALSRTDLLTDLRDVARTAADGTFVLSELDGAHAIAARAKRAGCSPAALVGETRDDLRLVVARDGATIRGHVLAADGAPAAGTRVWVGPETGVPTTSVRFCTLTDERGDYTIAGVPPIPQRLTARRADHAPWSTDVQPVTASVTWADVRLQRGFVAEGVVRDDADDAVAEATVTLATDPFTTVHAATGTDGAWRIEHVPPGPARFVTETELGSGSVEVAGDDGARVHCEIRLDGGRAVRGDLVDEHGRPLDGWTLLVAPDRADGEVVRVVEVDARGAFAFAPPGTGPWRIGVRRPGATWFEVAARGAVHAGDRGVRIVVPDRALATGSVTGRLLGDDGRPLAGAVRAHAPDRGELGPALELDADGTFALTDLPVTAWEVHLERPDHADHVLWRGPVDPTHAIDLGELRLPARGRLRVTVDGDTALRGIAGFRVVDAEGTTLAAVDAAALQRGFALQPGSYRLVAGGDGVSATAWPFTVAPDVTTSLAAALAPGIAVDCEVGADLLADGMRAHITVVDAEGAEIASERCPPHANAPFRARFWLANGRYTLRVDGAAPAARGFAVPLPAGTDFVHIGR